MTRPLLTLAMALCLCGLAPAAKPKSSHSTGNATPSPGAAAVAEAPPLDREQLKQLAESMERFKSATEAAYRKEAVERINGLGPRAAAVLQPLIDARLERLEQQYIEAFAPMVRAAYLKRLGELSDDQIFKIQKTRRLWRPYLLEPRANKQFRQIYLRAIWDIAAFVLLKPEQVLNESLKTRRRELSQWAGYQAEVHRVLKIDPDPTHGKVSPTGIAYAPLDQPPTFQDKLHHLERTLVLVHTLAPPGADKGLMMNDRAAREIDVQEAEFVMFANEVRLLAGTVVWRADALGCAVTRDHSNDRKNGKASGHMSSIPEKRGFGDRNRRMGAPFFNSEGAGGGRSGRGYITGLSYSGTGHGGPLYSIKRNCVGVGRRGGVYTSQYRPRRSP